LIDLLSGIFLFALIVIPSIILFLEIVDLPNLIFCVLSTLHHRAESKWNIFVVFQETFKKESVKILCALIVSQIFDVFHQILCRIFQTLILFRSQSNPQSLYSIFNLEIKDNFLYIILCPFPVLQKF